MAHVASEPESAEEFCGARRWASPVFVLGGGGKERTLAPGLLDMERIDPAAVAIPSDHPLDAGLARDLAMIFLRPSDGRALRQARITNHRWALSALGAGAACTLKPDDTVLSSVPLYHPTGVLVSVGSAIVTGSRLALEEGFVPLTFLADARRVGATVVFYAGEMLRALLVERAGRGDRTLPVRLFAGSGMRPEFPRRPPARALRRGGDGVLRGYRPSQDPGQPRSGEKPGPSGAVLPGSAEVAVVEVDLISAHAGAR